MLHAAMAMGISGSLLKATMKQEDIAAAVRQAVANLNGREDGRDDGRSSDAALFADALQDYLVGGRGTWEALQDRFSGQARLRTPPAHPAEGRGTGASSRSKPMCGLYAPNPPHLRRRKRKRSGKRAILNASWPQNGRCGRLRRPNAKGCAAR